ncbi:MAG: tape measure protein [Eubacteriales bacterium]|nr:tape measure protein [Eubacteriales bacterium]
MATELGKAYVQIIPSAKGISDSITDLLAPESEKAGEKAGSLFSGGFKKNLEGIGKSFEKAGNWMTKHITKPALIAGAAIEGLTIGAGFKRLVGIDTAKAQLAGLGHDAETVSSIMDNALASVKGTAFGMAEAATTAATAVAAGIQPGQELERYLSLVADAAAIAGVDMGEMGSVFNRVATSGIVQAQELNMMLDRGIPIIQMLSESMGVGVESVRELASAGEISSQDFYRAVELGMGGAAQKVGELSVSAAWDNTKAALGRLGAAFLGAGDDAEGVFDAIKPLLGELTDWLDGLAPMAEEAGKRLRERFDRLIDKIKSLIDWWKKLSPGMQEFIKTAGAVVVGLGPLLKMLGKLSLALTSPIGIVGVLASAFVSLILVSDNFRNAVVAIWNGLKAFFTQIVPEIIMGIIDWFAKLPENIATFFSNAWGTIKTWASNVWQAGIEAGSDFIASIVEWFSQLPANIADFFASAWEQVKAWASNMAASAVATGKSFLINILQWLNQLPYQIGYLLGEVIATVARWAASMVKSAVQLGKEFIKSIIDFFKQLPKTLADFFKAALTATVAWVKDMISKAVEIGREFLRNVIDVLKDLPGQLWDIFTEAVSRVAEWGTNLFKAGIDAAKSLAQAVWQGIKDLPKTMLDIGKQVVHGFWEGIKSLASWLAQQVANFFKGIIDGVKKVFGIASPSKIFAWMGEMNIVGLAEGMEDNLSLVSGVIDELERDTSRELQSNLAITATRNAKDLQKAYENPENQLLFNDQILGSAERLKVPADLHVYLGKRVFEKHIEDITNEQNRKLEFELSY